MLLRLLLLLLPVMEHAAVAVYHLQVHLVLPVVQVTMVPLDRLVSQERMDKMLHHHLHRQKLNGALNVLKPEQDLLADLDQKDHLDNLAKLVRMLMAVKEDQEDHLDPLVEQDNPEVPAKQVNQEHREFFETFQDLLADQAQLVHPDSPETPVVQDNPENKEDLVLKVLLATRELQEVQENQALMETKDHRETKATQALATIVHLQEQHRAIKQAIIVNHRERREHFITIAMNYNTVFSLIIVRAFLTAQFFKY